MKGVFSAPGDYVYFKSQVPLHKIPIGTKQWRYYDFGPKVVPPLICLPGIAGTADVYYKQIMSLSMKGYRVISVDIPRVWNHHEWVQAFEKFLDVIDVHHHRPRRVRSLILSNTFLDTRSFAAAMPWAPVVSWTPAFLLKRYVLTGIRDGPHEPFIADSVDFVVSQVETLSREDLASRLTLNVDAASVGSLLLSDSYITIMDLHLRRVGVEARPDLVRGIPKDGTGGSHSEKEKKKEDPDDQPKDGGSSESRSGENQLPPASEISESHAEEKRLFSNAKGCLIAQEDISHLRESLRKKHITTTDILLQSTCESILPFLLASYVQSLYITTKLLSKTWATGVK
ncbi:hypothetical protein GH714_009519 [Hevea brasiliensis]|uniref:AB hydrolase-1 domain-containing protein n=1 Tax=Hevea brasiliensis TaxID=3981 RepID=A0A6A6MLB7_HEVBR|nr:hypothetical protein GH714_009519 [Hevea brasiliensis]